MDKRLGREAGADGHITKPFTSKDLAAEVEKHLEAVRPSKFSGALRLRHTEMKGRKMLFEFDPGTPYERCIRDFCLEARAYREAVVVLTPKASPVHQALEEEKAIDLIPLTEKTLLSPILEAHAESTSKTEEHRLHRTVTPRDAEKLQKQRPRKRHLRYKSVSSNSKFHRNRHEPSFFARARPYIRCTFRRSGIGGASRQPVFKLNSVFCGGRWVSLMRTGRCGRSHLRIFLSSSLCFSLS